MRAWKLTEQPIQKDYQLNIERRPEYLLIRVSGQNSPATVLQYLQDVRDECTRQDCFRVLIDEQLDGPRLDISEVFSIASEGAMSAMGIFQAIAYVDPKMGTAGDFAEDVAVNRGMPVRTFATIDEAECWILGQSEGAAEKTLFEDHNSRKPLS